MIANDLKYDFPDIADSCFVVEFRDASSSKRLDTDFNLLTTDKQKAYLVYLSLDSAKAYIGEVLKTKPSIEGLIYDSRERVIDIVRGVCETA
jgi:hypothetical protein